MRVVVALGGNALGNTLPEQFTAVKLTASAIADLIELGHEVVITHGNGPQVGIINNAMSALMREDPEQPPTPLSVCVAMSQAYIGYDLQNSLREELKNRGLEKPVVTMVTQVCVDPADPAFYEPTKPIGKFYLKDTAERIGKAQGWLMKEDSGRGWRRYVPSPKPIEIIEADAIKAIAETGQVVIACGGGGIPVVHASGCHLMGVSAVIDKDLVSCLLAKNLEADALIILTTVERVCLNYGKADMRELDRLTPEKAEEYISEGHFAPGSMLPKVRAAADFAASKSGRRAIITKLSSAKDALSGKTGTIIEQ